MMTKALFRKQLMESFAWVYQDKKTGKNRSGKGLIAYVVLYLTVFGVAGSAFYEVANMLCPPLLEASLGWLYFALMGLVGAAVGIFASVFSTYTTLYQAKDNDLLFAMPIPANYILIARLTGVYAMGLLYELIVMIPVIVVYFLYAQLSATKILFTVLIPLVMSLFVLALTCVLGWGIAWCASKLKNSKFVTTALSLIFLACYFVFFSQSTTILENFLLNPAGTAVKIQGTLYPFYHMGLAAEGSALSMLIFSAIMLAVFGVVYIVLSRSFLKLATANRGAVKAKYIEKKAKASTPNRALLRKEFKRFFGSTTYMLNCGLGIVFILVAAIAIIVEYKDFSQLIFGMFPGLGDVIPLIAVAGICMMTTMNDMSAPSVSLEGKNIWILQVMPVSGWQVLSAKLNMHLILTLIPTAVLTICIEWLIKPSILPAILIPIVAGLFVLFIACLGLVANLKLPNLNWTSEIVPIKQSASVMIAMFGGWVVVLLLGGLYYLLMKLLAPSIYLLCVASLLLVTDIVMLCWIRTWGAKIFETL